MKKVIKLLEKQQSENNFGEKADKKFPFVLTFMGEGKPYLVTSITEGDVKTMFLELMKQSPIYLKEIKEAVEEYEKNPVQEVTPSDLFEYLDSIFRPNKKQYPSGGYVEGKSHEDGGEGVVSKAEAKVNSEEEKDDCMCPVCQLRRSLQRGADGRN